MEKSNRAAEIQDAIRQVLRWEWNPIGVSDLPEDEYDGYVGPVYRILTGSRSEQEVMNYLFAAERDTIGMASGSSDHLRPVARKLLEINVSL